jgi:glycosyltransferase involved in cell wall biosynthesis
MTEPQPIRVLHVIGSLNLGGVETWLMEVFRHVDRSRFAMDVLVHSSVPAAFDEEARDLGVSIIPAAEASQPGRFAHRFIAALRTGPGYGVVHSHVHHFSAYPLALARLAGVPVRIAHSHADTLSAERSAPPARRLYLTSTRRTLGMVATDRLAASAPAGRALFGPEWPSRDRDRVLHYGFDFRRYEAPLDGVTLRRDLGIPPDAFVIGHVGRFDPVKNHAFLVEVMAEVARSEPAAVLLLVGDGPTRRRTEELVAVRGLSDRVVFAGARSDVPEIMRAAMDVVVLPSTEEGLGIVGLEAQAAGVRCLFSDRVPREVSVVPELTRFLALDRSPSTWARALLESRHRALPRSCTAERLGRSSFGIDACLGSLAEAYSRRPNQSFPVPRDLTGIGSQSHQPAAEQENSA